MYVLELMAFKPRKVKNPTTDSIMFIHYLEQNKFFKDKEKEIRKRLHLPEEGLSLRHFYKSVTNTNFDTYPHIRGLTQEENNIFYTVTEYDGWMTTDPFHHNQQEIRQLTNKLWKSKGKLIEKFFETYTEEDEGKNIVEEFKEVEEVSLRRKGSGFAFIKLMDKMHKDIIVILKKLRLPDGFYKNIFMALTFNAIYDIRIGNTGDFIFAVGKHNIIDQVNGSTMPVLAVIFPYQFTYKEILNYFKVNRKVIDDIQKKYLVEKLPFRNAKYLSVLQEIYELRTYKRKKYDEIITILLKKYKDNKAIYDWLTGKDAIKQAYKRYKDDLKVFPEKNKWIWKILELPQKNYILQENDDNS